MPGTDRTDYTNEFAGRLNDWLDRLVIDAPPADARIDPVTVATVEHFFARDDAPPPPPDLADQVWNSIMRGSSAMPHGSAALVVTRSDGNGRHSVTRQAIPVSVWAGPAPVAGRTSRVTPAARRWGAGFAQATSVLLLVLMLGLGYLALMLGTGSNRGPGAIVSAPTHPAVDMTDADTLLELTLPGDMFADASDHWIGLVNITIPPGTTGQWLGNSPMCCPGIRVDYVVEGAYTVVPDGPIDVRRVDGREETIIGGSETVLGPGDSMIVPEGIGFTNTNSGSVPVHVLGWQLYHGTNSSLRSAANWYSGTSHWADDVPMRAEAVTLNLERVRLAPGVMVPTAGGTARFVVTPDPKALLGEQSDGSIRNVGKSDITAYVLTAIPASAPPPDAPEPTHAAVDPTDAETLLSLTLPANILPNATDRWIGLVNIVVEPGTTGQWLGDSPLCCPGARIDYVVEGAYTVVPDGPIDVRWADGREENVPAGTEIVLGPGDRMLVPEGIGFTNSNAGSVPVRVVGSYLYHGSAESFRSSANWLCSNWCWRGRPVQDGALTLQLQRVQLDPGVTVPSSPDSARFVTSVDDNARLGEQSDGSFRNVGKSETTVYILTATTALSDTTVDGTGMETTDPAVDTASGESLLSLTLPPELLPTDAEIRVLADDFLVQPGTTGEWLGTSTFCCSGVRVDYVVGGAYTVLPDGQIEVRRSDGREETIPAGTEIVLGPGDLFIVPEGVGFTNANNGDIPVQIVGWYLHGGTGNSIRAAPNWMVSNLESVESEKTLSTKSGAVTLELRRTHIEPGGSIPPGTGSAQFVIALDGNAMLGEQSDGSVHNVGKTEFTAFILTAIPADIPAPDDADPTIADLTGAETLLTLTLPPELLPQNSERRTVPINYMVQPGTTGEWVGTDASCCAGVRVDYVVEGSYTVQADGPFTVRRADGQTESIPAGTDVVLGPGDCMIVPAEIRFTNANNGSTPVRVIGWYLRGGAPGSGGQAHQSAGNWSFDSGRETTLAFPSGDGPVTLTLSRIGLAPGVTVPQPSGSVRFVVSLDPLATLSEQSDGSFRNVGDAEITAYVLTATAAPSSAIQDGTSEADAEAPLLSLTLMSDLFPADVWDSAVLVNATIPPRTQGAWPGMESPCCSGVRIDYVAQGTVTIRAEDEVQVTWADGRLETIPANEEIALGPGDTLITPRDIPFVNANSGDEPVRLIGWILDAGMAWQTEVSNWHRNSSSDFPPSGDFPADPEAITLTLRQMEIPAGGDVPATPGALRFIASLDASAMFGERSDGTVRNVGSTTATAYVLTMEPAEVQ